MPYQAILDAEIQAGEPVSQPLMQKIKDNFEDHEARLSGGGTGDPGLIGTILNGSLEADGDGDGVPDNWSVFFYPGGTGGYDTTDYVHGTKSYKFVHPGGQNNGGGYLESDYVFANFLYCRPVWFAYKASASNLKIEVVARVYDKNKAYLGDQVIYSSVSHKPGWALSVIRNVYLTYQGAEYVKFRFIGGKSDTNVAGSVWFDAIGIEGFGITFPVSESINQGSVYNYYNYYVDVGSVWNINLPDTSRLQWMAVQISVNGGWDGGDPGTWWYGYARVRIGSRYSTEVVSGYGGGGIGYAYLDISGLSGPQQLRFQVRSSYPWWGVNASLVSDSNHRKYYASNYRDIDHANGTTTDTSVKPAL